MMRGLDQELHGPGEAACRLIPGRLDQRCGVVTKPVTVSKGAIGDEGPSPIGSQLTRAFRA